MISFSIKNLINAAKLEGNNVESLLIQPNLKEIMLGTCKLAAKLDADHCHKVNKYLVAFRRSSTNYMCCFIDQVVGNYDFQINFVRVVIQLEQ